MRVKRIVGTVFLCTFVFIHCQNREKVDLRLDFSKAENWRFLLGVDVHGNIAMDTIDSSFVGGIRTYLEGTEQDENGMVQFTTSGTRITSNFLSEQKRRDLEYQFEGMRFSFSPHDEIVAVVDSSSVPAIRVGGWDLYRSFVKVIPVFPGHRVAPGATWERQRQFPVETTQGSAMGHLYQSFKFESVFENENNTRMAAVSWDFTYRIELIDVDSISIIEDIPLEGKGNGNFMFNIAQRALIKADAQFEVAQINKPKARVEWSESVHLELLQ